MRYTKKIVIADRSPLYREGLKIALASDQSSQFIEIDSVEGLLEYTK